jgi:intermediate peptidase
LARLKTGKRENGDIYPWDRHLYSRYIPKSNNTNADSVLAHLGNNITIGSVFEGLSKIYQTLFGIRLEPDTVNLGETWHEDVRRLNVIHETEGILGVVYCDLFERDQVSAPKFDGAAHFTVRCSRRIDLDSLDPAWTTSDDPYFYDYSDTNTIIKDSNNRKYQLPIVVLSMKLPRNDRLSMSEVETIFHEMGHALHCNTA